MKQKTIIVTGSGGLIGSESVKFFIEKGFRVIGIDNNMREYFFGKEASTAWNVQNLNKFENYEHYNTDIRDYESMETIFKTNKINGIIHTAAQPSHDWAATNVFVDFNVNATGTLNLLELTRKYNPEAVFIHMSTNKVYGDTPNLLPFVETDTRYEIDSTHPYYNGIPETMSIDQSKHSLFGASKLYSDIITQEYSRYFDMKTCVLRGGCLTGQNHSGTMLHGFLSYLVSCNIRKKEYTILGYKGKQVRDNIHSFDVVNAMYEFYKYPKNGVGSVYNIGGSRHSNCSIIEAIEICENLTGHKMNIRYDNSNRSGDHIWYISDVSKFRKDYPDWTFKYNLYDIIEKIHNSQVKQNEEKKII